jgi:hypothetical protein
MSVPLSTGGPPQRRIGRLYTLVWGWGIFNRLYGDFCTGADKLSEVFGLDMGQGSRHNLSKKKARSAKQKEKPKQAASKQRRKRLAE